MRLYPSKRPSVTVMQTLKMACGKMPLPHGVLALDNICWMAAGTLAHWLPFLTDWTCTNIALPALPYISICRTPV